jgi:DNA-directed RNA polymerase subunit RPC12/RpoP
MTTRDNPVIKKAVGESFEEKLERAPQLRQCPHCGHTWKARGKRKGSKKREIRCPKCNTRRVD